jgi:flagellin
MSEITRISNSASYNGMTLLDGASTSFGANGGSASVLHIGSGSSSTTDRLSITVNAMTLGALGLSQTSTTVSTSAGALSSLSLIDSDMGAYVNRLEFAISNLGNQIYNTQDAESRIRDADFAKETTEFTRAQILTQSATSMLAQANQVPQGVLSLLAR